MHKLIHLCMLYFDYGINNVIIIISSIWVCVIVILSVLHPPRHQKKNRKGEKESEKERKENQQTKGKESEKRLISLIILHIHFKKKNFSSSPFCVGWLDGRERERERETDTHTV